ncbi:hypothetical protein QUF70_15760 [Desulfobacterales bacterium HSG17]|nr:hypothetical protein [Desulfobacterales bacterium HSG17]
MSNFWKNKKVTAYIALKHHTRFIIPLMEGIASQGAKIEYLVAQAERSQEITAIETNLDYSHIFDFLDDSDTDEIYKNYHIMRKGFASALLKDKAFSLQMTTVIDKTLFATAQEYVGFKNYLKKTNLDLCIVLHELNRWGKMFSFHAKKQGVPLITLQEGLLTTASSYLNFDLTGHAQYSILNLVWGRSTKEKLCSFEAPEEKIIPVGNTHIITQINKSKQNNIREKKRKQYNHEDCFVILLLFSITLIPTEELLPLFNIMQDNKDFSLFIKFHPASPRKDIDKWIKQIPEQFRIHINFIHGEEDTYNLMAMSDLCVLSEASTTGLEALAFGKPLVELDLETAITHDSFLAEKKAAIKLTPKELSEAIKKQKNFSSMIDQDGVQNYLKSELHEPDKSIDKITNIIQSVIQANQSQNPDPLVSETTPDTDWSIIVPIVENSDILMIILEAIATLSQNENFEVILIQPEKISKPTKKILQSLEGDISILTMKKYNCLTEMINLAGISAKGKNLVFMGKNLIPGKDWLNTLKRGINKFGKKKIFGGKIINRFNNLVHAGMVVDANNCPVSAYSHLDKDFPHTCKTRSFQMLNHFLGIDKDFFLTIGGFNPQAGRYLFMDICLRALEITNDKKIAIYLHDIELIQAEAEQSHDEYGDEYHDSIFFYSKWNKMLWENEKNLYENDGVSNLQLDAARMTRAMEIASLK